MANSAVVPDSNGNPTLGYFYHLSSRHDGRYASIVAGETSYLANGPGINEEGFVFAEGLTRFNPTDADRAEYAREKAAAQAEHAAYMVTAPKLVESETPTL